MNGRDLLIALGDISQKYYDEAENETTSNASARKSIRRPMLIAAIIALTALLVGCAVVYALRLQDMSVGTRTYTQRFDDEGRAIEPTEKTMDILTMYGHSGDAIQLALTEWYEFLETYDPNGELSTNDPNLADIPDRYEYTYYCYTQEMVDKVDEIAEKYNLKLLDTRIPFQQYQSDIFLKETGINSLLRSGVDAETQHMVGMLYPPYNFSMEFALAAEDVGGSLWASYTYTRKDYFPRDYYGGSIDLSLFEQWDYTVPDGTQVLLALSNKGQGYIIAEQENAMIIISIDGNRSNSAYPDASEVITKEELEDISDLFDYSIQPQEVDRDAVQAQLDEAEAAYQAEHAYVPETYGSFTDYLEKTYRRPDEDLQYTFYDMTGDGEEELLLGSNGAYDRWITIRDGEAKERMVFDTYLCEGNVEERCYAYDIYETHLYYAPLSDTVIDDIDAERELITALRREQDQWFQNPSDYVNREEITAEKAQSIISSYHRIELDWKPLMEYPISEEQTFGEYLEAKDKRLSQEELLEIYKTYLENLHEMNYSHYRILDINGDNVDDLLLKGEADAYIGDTDYYWTAVTYRYGQMQRIAASDFYLCEDGVLENVSMQNDEGVEMTGHEFFRYEGFERKILTLVVYNKATASWQSDWYDTPMDTAEAENILAKYPRIDQGMRPISELLD